MTATSAGGSPPSDQNTLPTDAVPAVVEHGGVDANAAESSTADVLDAKQPASLLDVIKSAVEPAPQAEVSSTTEAEEGAAQAEGEADEAKPEVKDDADLPFHNHPRWKELLAERDSFREPAEQYGKITGFMQEHGLAAEEVAEGFEVMALLKSGAPDQLAKAREWFATRLTSLDEALGEVLPEDLRSRVDEGLTDEETARELARARARTTLAEGQEKGREEREAQAKRERETADTVTAMRSAVEGWETKVRSTDPDYAKKAELVETTCRAIVHRTGKPPKTGEEAVALAEQALAEVNGHFKSLLPKPRPITPSPTGSSATTVSAPKTLAEAVRMAVAST